MKVGILVLCFISFVVIPIKAQHLQFDSTGRLVGIPKGYYILPENFKVNIIAGKVDSKKIVKARLKKVEKYLADPNTLDELKKIGFEDSDLKSLQSEVSKAINGTSTTATYFPWEKWLSCNKLLNHIPYGVELIEKERKTGLIKKHTPELILCDTATGYVSNVSPVTQASEIKYTIKEIPALPKIIKSWFDETGGDKMVQKIQLWNFLLPRIGNDAKQLKNMTIALETATKAIGRMPAGNREQIRKRNQACSAAKDDAEAITARVRGLTDTIAIAEDIKKDYLKFLLKWLWLNENLSFFNPFEKINASGYIDKLKAQLNEANQNLIRLTVQQNAIDSKISVLLNAIQIDRSRNFIDVARIKDTVFVLTTKRGLLDSEKAKVLEKANDLKKTASNIKPSDLVFRSKVLNEGRIIYSVSEDRLNYVRHHDFLNNFERMNKDENLYPDFYSINVALHNVPISDTIKFEVVTKTFKEESLILSDLGPAVEELAKLDVSGLPNMSFAIDSFSSQAIEAASENIDIVASRLDLCDGLADKIMALKISADALQKKVPSLNTRKVFMPSLPEFTDKKGPVFRSELKQLDSLQAPKIVSYTLSTNKTEESFKDSFKFGKTFRFLPAAGYVYSSIDYPKIEVKDQSPVRVGEYGGMIATVGIKTYFLQRSFLANRDFFWDSEGEVKKGMWFIYTGVAIPKAKHNYLLGGGIDVASGFSVTAGIHMARISQPQFENGKSTGSSNNFYRASPYVGLTIDPALVVDIIKLF